jgi:hypothetical protein
MKVSSEYGFATMDIRALPDDALDDIIGGTRILPGSCDLLFCAG